MSAKWTIDAWGNEYPPENAEEILAIANGLIEDYAETHNEEDTDEYSMKLWEYYCYSDVFGGEKAEALLASAVINASGKIIDYRAAAGLMDDEIREDLHAQLAPCTEQEFFSAYEKAHAEKFGEEWELSKRNPCW